MISWKQTGRDGKARVGVLTTPRGQAATPLFMPVGTAGSVKGLTPDQLRDTGSKIILANTYHLMLRPGDEVVRSLGGLHAMMAWDGPVLTDSGGYQVFSLAHTREVSDDGVCFASHIDGAKVVLSPARAMEVQHNLGADIVMQLDECPAASASKDHVAAAVRRSAEWAAVCRRHWDARGRISAQGLPQSLFGIQQGGSHADLRAESARRLVELDLPGYAIGGLSVGEDHGTMCEVLDSVDGQFPLDRPRYVMGMGEPRDIVAAVARGADMFDCVLPTRNGRNAQAFTWSGRMRLRNSRWAGDRRPVEESCGCYACRHFSRGTIRHLFMAREMLGPTLVSIHNLRFFADFMSAVREAILAGRLDEFSASRLPAMYDTLDDGRDYCGGGRP